MGTSGAGIFGDDVAAGVRDEYLSMLAEGYTDKEALETILDDWKESITDDDEGPVVWLALAATQWEYGRLDASVKSCALRAIDTGEDRRRWIGSPHAKRRDQVLLRLKAKLEANQPKKRKPRKRNVSIDESITVKSPDQMARFTVSDHSNGKQASMPFTLGWVHIEQDGLEHGERMFSIFCHYKDIRLKWLDNETVHVSYPQDAEWRDKECMTSHYLNGRKISVRYLGY